MAQEKQYSIGIIPGDGIGRDVIKATMIVLDAINDSSVGFSLNFHHMITGDAAYEKYGNPFPQETFDGIAKTDAVLFGAAGDPHTVEILMGFRLGFNLYANVRPIKSLRGADALKPKANFVVVRENTEGLYCGAGYVYNDTHVNLRVFTTEAMERILRFCFELARKEGWEKVTFTHKAHVLTYTDAPMRDMFYEIAKNYPDIEAEDMTIDACAMQIVMNPDRFGVVFAENANGDILSDVGAGVIGGMGYAYSGNIGESMGVFEPIHGTAPKYADKGIVNPSAAILAAKMMLEHLGETAMGQKIETALEDVLSEGKVLTYHMGGNVTTSGFAEAVAEKMTAL